MAEIDPYFLITFAVVFAVYSAVLLVVAHKVSLPGYDGFLLAGRRVGVVTASLGLIGLCYGGFVMTGWLGVGNIFGVGALAFTAAWLPSLCLLFGYLAPRVRDRVAQGLQGAYSSGDFFAGIYDERMRVPVMTMAVFRDLTVIAFEILAGALVLYAIAGLSFHLGVLITTAIVLAYTLLGGFRAVTFIQVMQCIIFTASAFVVMFLMIDYAGGWAYVSSTVAAAAPLKFSFTGGAPTELVQTWTLTMEAFYFCWLPFWQYIYAAKNKSVAVRGGIVGMIGLALALTMIIPMGLALSVAYPGMDPNTVGPYFQGQLWNMAQYGVYGKVAGILAVTALVAAIQSTVSGVMIAPSLAVTHDIFRVVKKKTDEVYLKKVSQVMLFVMVGLGLIILYAIPDVMTLFMLGNGVNGGGLFFPIMFALWATRRANRKAALLSALLCGPLTCGIYMYGYFYNKGIPAIPGIPIAAITIGLAVSFVIMMVGAAFPRKEE